MTQKDSQREQSRGRSTSTTCSQEELDKAFSKIMRCASAREQSTHKVRKKLLAAGYSKQVTEAAIAKALHYSILDDERYCSCLIRSALAQGKGIQLVMKDIERMGIDPTTLDAYQEYVDSYEDDMEEKALGFLKRHPTRSKNAYGACIRKLLAKGFTFDVAASATKAYLREAEQSSHSEDPL